MNNAKGRYRKEQIGNWQGTEENREKKKQAKSRRVNCSGDR